MKTRILALLIPLLVAAPFAVAETGSEDAIRRQVLAHKATTVGALKVDGDWAACEFAEGEGGGMMVLRREHGRWTVLRVMWNRGGPLAVGQWKGLPSKVIATFGYGPVPKTAKDALVVAAHKYHHGTGEFGIATFGSKLFACTRVDRTGGWAERAVWEYLGGRWSRIFSVTREPSPWDEWDRLSASHGFSLYMTHRLGTGNGGSADAGKF